MVESWIGLRAYFKVDMDSSFSSPKDFEIKFFKSSAAEMEHPPSAIIFNAMLSSMEFEESLVRYLNKQEINFELGQFVSKKTRALKKALIQ